MTTEAAVGTRWLTEEEERTWVGLSTLTSLLPARLDAQLQRDSNLTLFEYFVLSRLSMAPDRRLRMRELAVITNGTRSRLSNVVNKLLQQGLISRTVVASDRRGAVAQLTDAGWDVVVAAAPGHVEAVRTLVFDRLSPEQLAALRGLGELFAEDIAVPPGTVGPCTEADEAPC